MRTNPLPKVLFHGLAAMVLAQCLSTIAVANPYSVIAELNSFGLLEPPDSDTGNTNTLSPSPELELAGIITVDIRRALIKRKVPGNQQTRQVAEETQYVMAVGKPAVDGIQVLAINDHPDLKRATAKVRYNGKESLLHLCAHRLPRDKLRTNPLP